MEMGLIDKGIVEAIKALLKKYRLPTTYHIKDVDMFYNQFFLDKKSIDNRLKFILPTRIGEVIIKNSIDKTTIMKVLQQFATP